MNRYVRTPPPSGVRKSFYKVLVERTMETPMVNGMNQQNDQASGQSAEAVHRKARRSTSGRLLDLKAAEVYSGISAWTLRDLIASGDLPVVRPPRLRRIWIDRADLDRAIADWKERGDR
jgi:hypothetical protein